MMSEYILPPAIKEYYKTHPLVDVEEVINQIVIGYLAGIVHRNPDLAVTETFVQQLRNDVEAMMRAAAD